MTPRPLKPIRISALVAGLTVLFSSFQSVSGADTEPKSVRSSWRLGISGWGLHRYTLFEAIELVQQMGLKDYDGLSFQKVSLKIQKPFNADLSSGELDEVVAYLRDKDVRLPVFYYAKFPTDAGQCRRVFEFGRRLGIQTFVSEPAPDQLDLLETFCTEFQIQLALHNHGPEQTRHYWHPDKVLAHCQGRSPLIGVCPDTGYWMRAGVDPVAGIRKIGSRLITLQLHDLNERSPEGHDVPWGTGVGQVKDVLAVMEALKLRPTLVGLEYSYDFENNLEAMKRSIAYFRSLRSTDVK